MKFSGFAYLVSIYHRSKFQGNLRHKGDIFKKKLDDLTWNYPSDKGSLLDLPSKFLQKSPEIHSFSDNFWGNKLQVFP